MTNDDAKMVETLRQYVLLTNADYGHNGPQNLTQLNLIGEGRKTLDDLMDRLPYGSYEYGLCRGLTRILTALQLHEEAEKGRHGKVIAVQDKHLLDLKAAVKRFEGLATLHAKED
jgi:hypothetical protein